jgi:PII-like signaling protein
LELSNLEKEQPAYYRRSMMTANLAKKLVIYVDETDRAMGKPVYEVVMEICYRNKISGVSVFRGVAGYGGDRVFHTSKILDLSTSLPVKIEAVDSADAITKILPEITAVVTKGLIDISDTTIIRPAIISS